MEIEGTLSYWGPDDSPADYYVLTTPDGKVVRLGVDAAAWGGHYHNGIPQIPMSRDDNKKCRITIEFLGEEDAAKSHNNPEG